MPKVTQQVRNGDSTGCLLMTPASHLLKEYIYWTLVCTCSPNAMNNRTPLRDGPTVPALIRLCGLAALEVGFLLNPRRAD